MIIRIDQRSTEPLYLQLRSQIIASIAQGDLVPGDVLPSVRSLANDLGINLHTVNKAYAV
ncbi:MAG: GntR family transcriptional regulator, partial [Raoultibacter sp.]